jgi:hypothetical protein
VELAAVEVFVSLIFVDCEASGPCIGRGQLTEFGAVEHKSLKTFHGKLEFPGLIIEAQEPTNRHEVFTAFHLWLGQFEPPYVLVSDNPAFDWQWINHGFWTGCGKNPFGHSARRIGDFYAGLVGDFWKASRWKSLRVTKHDHNPVHDALGNVEAFKRILEGER